MMLIGKPNGPMTQLRNMSLTYPFPNHSMKPTPAQIVDAMLATGGNFVKRLAMLWVAADPENKIRVERAFSAEFNQYKRVVEFAFKYNPDAKPSIESDISFLASKMTDNSNPDQNNDNTI
jgi:hypothetical protein